MVVKGILVNKDGKTIGIAVVHNNKDFNISTEELKSKYKNLKFDNAVLMNNGYVRGKTSKLEKVVFSPNQLTLYHGSPEKDFTPTFGLGSSKHDYGCGFYLTPVKELAKEWATCIKGEGYVHTYVLNLDNLLVFDFDKVSELRWIAELMVHREADRSVKYKRLAPEFIKKFRMNIETYDVIKGWRADSSYFSVAKHFVRDELDYNLISKLFHLGNLNIQYCLKSKKAFDSIKEVGNAEYVGKDYNIKYLDRDNKAREMLSTILYSEENTMQKGISYVMRRDFKL